jgi:general secretion pathway protein J
MKSALHRLSPPGRRHRPRGFTLVELLIALSVMAIMALLSWQGLDGMMRTLRQTDQHSEQTLALQSGLGQWQADLESLVDLPDITAIDWDGRVLRLTRQGPPSQPEATLVVGWTLRNPGAGGQWLRWQSPPLSTRGDWQNAWQMAALWGQNPDQTQRQREVLITPANDWQIFYYRQDAWTNPMSSDASTSRGGNAGTPPTPDGKAADGRADSKLPQGVRLVITLAPGQAVSGRITRDWVRPILGGDKS